MGSLFSTAKPASAPGAPPVRNSASNGLGPSGAPSLRQPTPAARERPTKRRRVAAATRDYAGAPSGSATPPRDAAAQSQLKRRKVAMFVAYMGGAYHGMQVNDGVRTVEGVLSDALAGAGLLRDASRASLQQAQWSRAARTDKGVSAAGQVVSLRVACERDGAVADWIVPALNAGLPDDVRVLHVVRATTRFCARTDCHRRRYEYVLPVAVLDQGVGSVHGLNALLEMYVGTKCFANFTEGMKGTDDAAKRYIIRVQASEPFRPPGSRQDYVSVLFYGQSFVLHQIRRMMGLALAVHTGVLPREAVEVALSPHCTLAAPTAPALGLLLDSTEFSVYNSDAGRSLAHPVELSDEPSQLKDLFKLNCIYREIAAVEDKESGLTAWLSVLRERSHYDKAKIMEDHQRFVATNVGIEEARKRAVAAQYPVTYSQVEFFGREDAGFRIMRSLFDDLVATFTKKTSLLPKSVIRAPGRVNLIGEHCDYNGFPVIGCATRQGTYLAIAPTLDQRVEVCHVNDAKFGPGSFEADGSNVVSSEDNPAWLRYVSWGWTAMMEKILSDKRSKTGSGAVICVSGDLPQAVGLGSSSSLVTAAAMAASRLSRTRVGREELALIAAEGERVGAGTRGGAVDHTVSTCGVTGSAVYVQFSPKLSTSSMQLPEGASFVVINSGVHAFKGGDTKMLFNTRVIESRVGAAIVARRLKTHLSMTVSTPGQLHKMEVSGGTSVTLHDVSERIRSVVEVDEEITLSKAAAEMGLEENGKEWKNRFLMGVDVDETSPLRIDRRLRHVIGEAMRVERFKTVLEENAEFTGKNPQRQEEVTQVLGKILSESHSSLRDMYECSCADVDRLVEYCLAQGALGARITGAGWGGCILSLVPDKRKREFILALKGQVGDDAVFVVEPSTGGAVLAM